MSEVVQAVQQASVGESQIAPPVWFLCFWLNSWKIVPAVFLRCGAYIGDPLELVGNEYVLTRPPNIFQPFNWKPYSRYSFVPN